jgi:hypothetical protein
MLKAGDRQAQAGHTRADRPVVYPFERTIVINFVMAKIMTIKLLIMV